MYKEFTYGSAFAGIGGMTMGLEQIGGKGVIAWEFDPTEKRTQYAQECHKLLHPHIPVEGDITKVNTEDVPYMDVFCFTPPCQAFSVAGKRGGFEDTRGTLTFDALQIAKDKQPKILFMENVKGLINHDKGNSMSTIVHAINEIGYVVDFTVLNSKYFDVAQNRERVYLIAIRKDLVVAEPWNNTKGNTMIPKAKKRYQEEGAITFNFDWPEQNEVRTRLRDFLEDEVDEKYFLSEEKTKELISSLEKDGKKMPAHFPDENGINNTIRNGGKGSLTAKHNYEYITLRQGLPIKEATKSGYSLASEGDSVNIQFPKSKTRRGRVGKQIANTLEASGINQGVVQRIANINPSKNGMNGNVYSIESGLSPTLTTNKGEGIKFLEEVIPVLTTERLNKKQNGRRFKEYGEESFNVTNIDRHGVAIGEYPKYKIRKLTPRECLRLQSVPGDKIDIILDNFSDSRAYKFAGNGLTTNVIKAIGEKLIKYL